MHTRTHIHRYKHSKRRTRDVVPLGLSDAGIPWREGAYTQK